MNQNKLMFSKASFIVTFSCFVFVLWQSFQCFSKYMKMPKGTALEIVSTADVPFPAITLCGYFRKGRGEIRSYNETNLQQCGIR